MIIFIIDNYNLHSANNINVWSNLSIWNVLQENKTNFITIHSPQFDLSVISSRHNKWHGGMERNPVDTTIMTLSTEHILRPLIWQEYRNIRPPLSSAIWQTDYSKQWLKIALKVQ